MKYSKNCNHKDMSINLASADTQDGVNVDAKAATAGEKSNMLANADTATDINGSMKAASAGSMDQLPVDMTYSYKS